MIPHISTTDGVTVFLSGRPLHVAREDKYYDEVLEAMLNGEGEKEIEEIIETVKRKIDKFCLLSPTLSYHNGAIVYKGLPLSGYAADKLVSLVDSGHHDAQPLTAFLDRLQNNPSAQTIENLYQFLEHGKMPLTERGTFLAYKAVRFDYMDIHSGTFNNSIGAEISMPRRNVDDRRENTCSYGFHVCSFDYLPHFSSANGHVVVCEVDPADVVSIPIDYNNTKMRVCKYKVIGEVEGYYQDPKHVLGEFDVFAEEYTVLFKEDDEWEEWGEYDDLKEALKAAEGLFKGGASVRVVNTSGVLMFEATYVD